MVERFNRTLVNMLATMLDPHRNQRDWDEHVPCATFAYRCTPQESTGETPNMMVLGREVALPLDLMLPTTGATDIEVKTDYVEQRRTRIRAAQRARQVLKLSARRQKRTYDQKASRQELTEGQFVWLYNSAKTIGKSPKLQCRWQGPYAVVKKLSEVTFSIQEGPRKKCKVVHIDRLKVYEGKPSPYWGTASEAEARDERPDIQTPIEMVETTPTEINESAGSSQELVDEPLGPQIKKK
ncbi:uncharacterized protein LOC117105992 [Anneissia japonica]|uniref:uncharacterized protein LOC117105992 n=1 Tax=Anneissia japonica TaxID=1529436 RepID=UPI00142567C0|nr:uncharacterized protein LOC117105992 [Anneissia japonica]